VPRTPGVGPFQIPRPDPRDAVRSSSKGRPNSSPARSAVTPGPSASFGPPSVRLCVRNLLDRPDKGTTSRAQEDADDQDLVAPKAPRCRVGRPSRLPHFAG
jgi:hypothetical protein